VNAPDTIRKLTRAERNEAVRQRLFEAAAKIVGELGYAEASIARITEAAGVAQGTFYNHFPSRQALLDELLPAIGMEMAHFIQERTAAIRPERKREIARFRAFFEYLDENPRFLRILNEAEFAAPEAYHHHIENMVGPFWRMLVRARDRGEVKAFDDGELEVVVRILMGARSYLSQHFAQTDPPEALFSAYAKLIGHGLFADE
jgi:AcrR family transcriptional regulator